VNSHPVCPEKPTNRMGILSFWWHEAETVIGLSAREVSF
jgi:hypothetical protein